VGEVKSYDQLSLLERVLLAECFSEQVSADNPQPVGYRLIADIRHTGWICTLDDRMLNPDYYFPAPLIHHLHDIDGGRACDRSDGDELAAHETLETSLTEIVIDAPNLVLAPQKTQSSFG
jgi:hypothetical protein